MRAVHGSDVLDRSPLARLLRDMTESFGGERILCAACGNGITTARARTSLFGDFVHHNVNPYGYEFLIGCFSAAPGCAIQGQPVPQDTWFPGYDWRFALCDHCATHLGWYYEAPDRKYFYGLILERLAEESAGA